MKEPEGSNVLGSVAISNSPIVRLHMIQDDAKTMISIDLEGSTEREQNIFNLKVFKLNTF